MDLEAPVAGDAPRVAGRVPAVRLLRVGAVPVRAKEHRAAQLDLTASGDPHLDAVERHAVVDDPAAALGHSVGDRHVRRDAIRRRGATEHDPPERGGSVVAQPPKRRRDERHEGRGALAGGSEHLVAVEAGEHLDVHARDDRSREDRKAAHVREGEAGAPPVGSRVDAEPRARRPCRRLDRVAGEHDALRGPGRARRRHDERVPGLDRPPAGERVLLPVRVDDGRRREGGDDLVASCSGGARVERHRGVARVEDPPQRREEGRSRRQVECDEPRHGG